METILLIGVAVFLLYRLSKKAYPEQPQNNISAEDKEDEWVGEVIMDPKTGYIYPLDYFDKKKSDNI